MTKLLLLIFGGLKLGKVLMSAGTMLASIAVYALFYGWRFAAGFVALLLVHEAGHYLARAARRRAADLHPVRRRVDPAEGDAARRGNRSVRRAAGPFVGTLGALACYAAARHTDSNLLLALSSGFFLNLFNMIPLSPFDGGRITAVLSPRIWFAGVPVLIALFVYRPAVADRDGDPRAAATEACVALRPRRAGEPRVLCDVDRDEDDVRALLRGPARVPRADDVRRARHAARRAFVDLTADI